MKKQNKGTKSYILKDKKSGRYIIRDEEKDEYELTNDITEASVIEFNTNIPNFKESDVQKWADGFVGISCKVIEVSEDNVMDVVKKEAPKLEVDFKDLKAKYKEAKKNNKKEIILNSGFTMPTVVAKDIIKDLKKEGADENTIARFGVFTTENNEQEQTEA